MKTKYTIQELKDKKIAIRCDTQEQADKIIKIFGGKNDYGEFYTYYSCYMNFFISDRNLSNAYSDHTVIPASEFFLEDEIKNDEPAIIDLAEQFPEYGQEVSKTTPESIPTEYAVLTNATESAKKQIAEFEQVLTQIKIDAMKLGSRDLARLIKALKAI